MLNKWKATVITTKNIATQIVVKKNSLFKYLGVLIKKIMSRRRKNFKTFHFQDPSEPRSCQLNVADPSLPRGALSEVEGRTLLEPITFGIIPPYVSRAENFNNVCSN